MSHLVKNSCTLGGGGGGGGLMVYQTNFPSPDKTRSSPSSSPIYPYMTSVKIIKNEVGCRDDTVPKTVDTRRHCEED